jgi:hypothetical protein
MKMTKETGMKRIKILETQKKIEIKIFKAEDKPISDNTFNELLLSLFSTYSMSEGAIQEIKKWLDYNNNAKNSKGETK